VKEVVKKILTSCKKSILFYTVIYIIIFIVSKVILNALGMKYMQYINYFSIILVLIGIISGVIQIFVNSKSKNLRICIIIFSIFIIGIILIGSPIILLFIGLLPPEHIVEKDNKKYVAYVYSWLDTRVEYYDYINFFLMGNTERIEDFYNNVGRDVLAEDAKGLFTPITSTNIYTKPSEIDLEQVFYNGAGFNNEIPIEELEAYKKLTKYHETDIVKITTQQAEKLYYENTGEKLENLKERLKSWIYIEKYDAYYHEISDTNFETVSCIKAIMDERNKIMKIQLSNNRTISVKIDYEKGTNYIISNNSTK